jgi:hypothetical protein
MASITKRAVAILFALATLLPAWGQEQEFVAGRAPAPELPIIKERPAIARGAVTNSVAVSTNSGSVNTFPFMVKAGHDPDGSYWDTIFRTSNRNPGTAHSGVLTIQSDGWTGDPMADPVTCSFAGNPNDPCAGWDTTIGAGATGGSVRTVVSSSAPTVTLYATFQSLVASDGGPVIGTETLTEHWSASGELIAPFPVPVVNPVSALVSAGYVVGLDWLPSEDTQLTFVNTSSRVITVTTALYDGDGQVAGSGRPYLAATSIVLNPGQMMSRLVKADIFDGGATSVAILNLLALAGGQIIQGSLWLTSNDGTPFVLGMSHVYTSGDSDSSVTVKSAPIPLVP